MPFLEKRSTLWFSNLPLRKELFSLGLLILIGATDLHAQLCSGKSGIPILLETFGSGTSLFGGPLKPGITNYPYIADWPPDGKYTISNTSNPNNGGDVNWYTEGDHSGKPNGYMMVVNSDMNSSKSELYRQRITGLCPYTNYTFAAWLANVNTPGVRSVCNPYAYGNVLFELVNPTTQAILDSVSTGNLPISTKGKLDWKQYGKTINTGPLTSIDVVMINTFIGGCGNDVLIDDISFAVCGPVVKIAASPAKPLYCIGDKVTLNGTLGAGYVNPAYQWQFSTDNNVTWNNLLGQTTKNLVFNSLAPAHEGTYRLLAAEAGNIGSILCGIVSDTLPIKVVPIPKFTVNNPAVCSGQSAVLTATIDPLTAPASFVWDNGGTGASINVTPPANPTPNPVVYKATATRTDGSGCTSSVLSKVTVNQAPVITVNPASICLNDKVTLSPSGSADTYLWSPATGLSATNQSQVDANPTTTTTYQLKAGFNTGCSTTIPVVVTVNNPPTLTAPNVEVCENGVVVLQASGTSSTYLWSPSTGLSATNTAQVSASQLPVGVNTYTLKGYSNFSCVNTINVTVTVNKNPVVSIAPVNPICNGGTATVTASINPVQTATYAWTAAPGDASMSSTSTQSFTASPISNTTYTVLVTDAKTCSNKASVIVQVNSPVINVKLHPPICEGDTAELRAYGASNYSWTPTATFKLSDGSVVFDAPTHKTTYTVTGTFPGCINTASKDITVDVNPKPIVSATDKGYCPGGAATLVATGNATNFNWAPALGLSSTSGATVTANPAMSAIYTLTGYSAFNCFTSAPVKVTVYPVPTITIAPVNPICSGKTTGLVAKSNDAIDFKWTPSPADPGMSSTTGDNIVVGPLVNTSYTVIATNANSCSNSAFQSVSVIDPVLNVVPHGPICIGDTAQLKANGADSYTWSSTATLNSTGGPLVISTPVSSGTNSYKIDALYKGCPISKNLSLMVNSKPVINIVNPPQTCIGTPVSITASGALTYVWAAETSLNSTVLSTVQANPLIPKTYTYSVTGTDINGCVNSKQTTLIANGLPAPVINPPGTICLGGKVPLLVSNASLPAIPTQYNWDASPDLNTTKGASVIAKPSGLNTTYSVLAQDANNCKKKTSVNVVAVNKITPQISDSVHICKGEHVKLTAGGGTSYHWKNIEAPDTSSIKVSPVVTTQYEVIISNGLCVDSARVSVYVKNPIPSKVFIPNAFTPNEDGLNDKFLVYASGLVTNFKGALFNRWGEIIFEWSDIKVGWDGYYKGSLVQLDVYVYKINVTMECATKEGESHIGTVTIVK